MLILKPRLMWIPVFTLMTPVVTQVLNEKENIKYCRLEG